MPSTRTVTEASFHAPLRFGRRVTAAFLGLCAGLPGLSAAASLPPAFRYQIMNVLLACGARGEAVFRSLAAHAPPGSPDVGQLLFAWGRCLGASDLAWLEARPCAIGGCEGDLVQDTYLVALGIACDRVGMAAAVRAELVREKWPDRLHALTIMADQSSDTMLPDRVLLLAAAGDAMAPRRVEINAYRRGELAFAERVLGAQPLLAGR